MISKDYELTVLIHVRKGKFYDITDALTELTWEGDYSSPSRTVSLSYLQPVTDKDVIKTVGINEGSTVCFYIDKKEVFRGNAIEVRKDSSSDVVNIVAKDIGAAIGRDKINKNYHNKAADSIAKEILTERKYKIGKLAKAPIKVTKVYKGKTLYETIMDVYTRQSKSDKKKYMLKVDLDKVSVIEKGNTLLKIAFNQGENLIHTTYSISIDDIVNRVEVSDKNGGKLSEKVNQKIYEIYKRFVTEVIDSQEGKAISPEEIEAAFKGAEKTCDLEGIGNPSCLTGTKVQIKDEHTGLVGVFYVDSDTHSWSGGKYDVKLKLNFENIMHEVEVGEDEVKDEVAGVDGVGGGSGREVEALFTAYYPANNAMEGGFYDCKGKRLNPNDRTCAAPKDIPYGMNVRFSCPGTKIDGQIYRVNDRGGAIKVVNGVYHFDILMHNNAECNAFGKRRGKAWILDGSGAQAGAVQERAVQWAISKIGSRYTQSAARNSAINNPNARAFDCSSLCYYSYMWAGVYGKPRGGNAFTTAVVRANPGAYRLKEVGLKNARRGDLLWKSGHMGMYIGNGRTVEAMTPALGVRYGVAKSFYTAYRVMV